jgi:hypothetical protein
MIYQCATADEEALTGAERESHPSFIPAMKLRLSEGLDNEKTTAGSLTF